MDIFPLFCLSFYLLFLISRYLSLIISISSLSPSVFLCSALSFVYFSLISLSLLICYFSYVLFLLISFMFLSLSVIRYKRLYTKKYYSHLPLTQSFQSFYALLFLYLVFKHLFRLSRLLQQKCNYNYRYLNLSTICKSIFSYFKWTSICSTLANKI